MENTLVNNKSCKIYFLVDDVKVYFNADFDSGNVQKVQQLSPYVFKITPGFDKAKNGSNKTFFHFKVYGLKMCTANFVITRMNMLQKLIKTHQKDESLPSYLPVYRKPSTSFNKITTQVKRYYNQFDQPELSFSFEFYEDQYVQFAFSYPYSYEDCQNLISDLNLKYSTHSSIYFHSQTLCYSQEKRKIHLITITNIQNCEKQSQSKVEDLFPALQDKRSLNVNKPVVFMSARVHPGECPASYSIQGTLRFLLNEKDCRSFLLRKNFVFKIIPMLNPDGVFHGMFRTDSNGQNLNRIYNQCSSTKFPTVWSIKKYATWLKQNKNVLFYFDFHAHPSTKNFFIYGNSFSQISMQTEAQLFGKMIEFNCPYFENFESIYSEKEMKAKHKHDNFSKEGCARVFMHKLFNIVHSYTVQCGFFGWTKLNMIEDKYEKCLLYTGNFVEDKQFQRIPFLRSYETESYMLMGKSILITILDLFGLNPYPKRIKGQIVNQSDLRKMIGSKIYHQTDTFKIIDSNSYRKLSDLSSSIQDLYYCEKLRGTKLKLGSNQSNRLLKEQLECENPSSKTKELLKFSKLKKPKTLTKLKDLEVQNKWQMVNSLSKLEPLKNESQFQKLSKTPSKESFGNHKQKSIETEELKQIPKYVGSKVKTLKFLYNDLQRFNEKDTEPISPRYIPASQKTIQTEPLLYLKSSIFQDSSLQSKNLQHLKVSSSKSYNTSSESKLLLPLTREHRVKSNIERSITLRKGSVSKVVVIRKDDIRYLRIANLIEKKIQKQAISGSVKKFKDHMVEERQKQSLPMIKGKRKF